MASLAAALAAVVALAASAPASPGDEPSAPAESGSAAAGTHPRLALREGRLQTASGDPTQPIPDVSAYCLDCHAGMAGERAGDTGQARPPVHPAGTAAANHPVDVVYPETARKYAPRADLSPRLALLDERMTCVTCHDPGDPEHGLVLPRDDSRLCRACHRI